MSVAQKLLPVLDEAIAAARQLLGETNVRPMTSRRKRLALLVFHDLLLKAESVRTLLGEDKRSGIEQIVRSAFESYVDLVNLYKHPKHYPAYVLYLSAEQQRRRLQAILNSPESPYSQSILRGAPKQIGKTFQEMIDGTLSEVNEHKSELTSQYIEGGHRPDEPKAKVKTSAHFRASMAGKVHEYEALYRMMSGATHADIGSMLNGVVLSDGRYQWPPENPKPSVITVLVLISWLLESARLIGRRLRRPVQRFDTIRQKLDLVGSQLD